MDLGSLKPDWRERRDKMLAEFHEAEAGAIPDASGHRVLLSPEFSNVVLRSFDAYALPRSDESVIEVLALLAGYEVAS